MVSKTALIQFHFTSGRVYLPHRTALKGFIVDLFKQEGFEVEAINYIFCNDAYLLEINRQYLNHDTYTDIVTFPLSEKGEPIVSDIYISTERVKANAETFVTSFTRELHRVIFHGALHLCGYKDKKKAEAEEMRKMEEECLKRWLGA